VAVLSLPKVLGPPGPTFISTNESWRAQISPLTRTVVPSSTICTLPGAFDVCETTPLPALESVPLSQSLIRYTGVPRALTLGEATISCERSR
jgi:hypothetical protein